MSFSEFTDPGPWARLYSELPDDLDGLIRTVKNLLIHPNDIRRFGMRVSPRRWQELRGLDTVDRMFGGLFARPPESLLAPRSAYTRLIKPCDLHSLLFASFCEYKQYEVRVRCGFAHHIAPFWIFHWLTEVRRPLFEDWTWVDADRVCRPARSDFRPGAEWWRRRDVEPVGRLAADRFHGPDAVKFAMLCDFNALNRREMIHYRWLQPESAERGPRVFDMPCSQIGPAHLRFLDEVARAVVDSDQEKLRGLFESKLYAPRPVSGPRIAAETGDRGSNP